MKRFALTPLDNMSLQKKIGLLVLSGLAVGLILFSWMGVQSVNESVERTLDERLTVARIMASNLDDTLEHVLLHLQSAAEFDGALPDEEQFASTAASLRKILAQSAVSVQNIILVDRDGKVIRVEKDKEDSEVIRMDVSVPPQVKRTLEKGMPAISDLASSPLSGMPVVFVTAPFLNGEGDIIGGIVALIDIEQSGIAAFSETITVGDTGYIEIVDGNGIVLARTSPGSPPRIFEMSDHPGRFAELISRGEATVRTCHRCHETAEQVVRQRDMLAFAPLTAASWGVAIRQSEEEALAPARQLERRLVLLGIIVLIGAFLLVWLMTQGVVKPLRMLTVATKRVASGDFKAPIPARRRDEIGELNTAFYRMTRELARSRNELISRNEELSALNSITAMVSQSLNLNEVLESALRKVLEVTKTTVGCVFLKDTGGNRLEMMTRICSSDFFECDESGSSVAVCACHHVLKNGQTMMVNHVSQCAILGESVAVKEGIGYFVSVPLKSKDSTLGIMNVAGSRERYFTENDFRLLDSIGYHVGLAIENSMLYEEAKQKEELRGQLLSSVITAQEEERKRLARELHDEYGQTLTGLIMNIESLEEMDSSEQSRFKEKLQQAKSLIVRALQDLRRLTHDLRPSVLDDLGLVAAIRSYAQNQLEAAGVEVKLDTKGLRRRLAPAVETALFRIIQEAIHNTAKYAGASNVKVQLEANDGKIIAIIEDDGKGFDVEAFYKSRTGVKSLGLLGIQERATLLGGTLRIESKIGEGTRLIVEIPVTSPAKESSLVKTQY